MIYDKTRALEPGYYEQFEMIYKPALEKDRKDAERYGWLRDYHAVLINQEVWKGDDLGIDYKAAWFRGEALDEAIDNAMRNTDLNAEPLLVAPPVTKGKAESSQNSQLNHISDDYDLTSNDTRRGD